MTDDEILDALDRRLAGVESRLPPTVVRPTGAIVVGPTRSGRRRSSNPLPSIIVVVLLVAAAAIGSRLTGGVSGVPASTGSAAGTAPVAPSSGPTAVALEIIRGPQGGEYLLTERFGWGPCTAGLSVYFVPPHGTAVDREIDELGTTEGWVILSGDRRVWVSDTAEAAAAALGATVLAIGGGGDRWVAIDGKGRQLLAFATPKGRTMWVLAGSVGEVPCSSNEVPSSSVAPS